MELDRENSLAMARVWQTLVCFSVLAVIGLSALALETAVHSEALGIWLDQERLKANDAPIAYERQFLDTEDRVTLQDLPDLDPSSGGVYFFGASNVKWGMAVPDLPSEQRKLVHNFGTGDGSPYYHRQFTKFLVRYKNILSAGPHKTLVVFGATFINRPAGHLNFIFANMWRRYGLYRYDLQLGIEPITQGPVWDAYALERARCSSFVKGTMIRAALLPVPKSLRKWRTEKDPAILAADYARELGPDWEETTRAQRRDLQGWLDDLRREQVEFQVALLPLASWHDRMPYPPKYRAMIEEFCAANHVPLTDCSNLLTDDEFHDSSHVNRQGLQKLHPALMEIARKFLQAQGAWPAGAGAGVGESGSSLSPSPHLPLSNSPRLPALP